jgi:hypothetical protein
MRDNATDKKRDKKQSEEGKEPIAKAALKKTPDAGAVERSPAYRSGNPIGRAYNGRGLILDSHK